MNRVRPLKGWDGWEFHLNTTLVDGGLRFSGVDPQSLPAGTYWLRVRISDLETPGGRLLLDIGDDQGDARVDVDVESDKRAIRVTTTFADFDPKIRAVLQAAGSELDGLGLEAWLASPDPRPNRKACLLNLMAKLRSSPSVKEPLIDDVESIFFGGTERIYGRVRSTLFSRLQALAADPAHPFYYEGTPVSAMHLRLLDRIEADGWGKASEYALHSFRQQGRDCMQVVVAAPSVSPRPYCADFDIDLGNPLQDIDGFVIHLGELAHGDTDNVALRTKFESGPISDFMYYDVA
jgi:hypothetical protein